MIKVENLSVYFAGEKPGANPLCALDGVSLRCAPGRITGILGANGAGKTTLMRVMAGILVPSAGSLLIGGEDVTSANHTLHDRLGFVTPESVLFDRLTPRESLRFIAKLRGMPLQRFEENLSGLAQRLAFTELLNRPADKFSTGQTRKVGLAAALLHNPQILAFDEPTSGLDIPSAAELRRHLRAEAAQGRTVVISSHSHAEVAEVCDTVHVLHQGRLRASGSPADLAAAHPSGRLEHALAELCRDVYLVA